VLDKVEIENQISIMAEECANPLLLQWLKEWMDQAQERNSKGYTVYSAPP